MKYFWTITQLNCGLNLQCNFTLDGTSEGGDSFSFVRGKFLTFSLNSLPAVPYVLKDRINNAKSNEIADSIFDSLDGIASIPDKFDKLEGSFVLNKLAIGFQEINDYLNLEIVLRKAGSDQTGSKKTLSGGKGEFYAQYQTQIVLNFHIPSSSGKLSKSMLNTLLGKIPGYVDTVISADGSINFRYSHERKNFNQNFASKLVPPSVSLSASAASESGGEGAPSSVSSMAFLTAKSAPASAPAAAQGGAAKEAPGATKTP